MSRKREEFRCVLRTGAEPNHSSCIGPPGAVAHRPAQCAGLSQRWQRQQQQQRWQRRGGGGGGGCSAALRGVPSVAEYHRPQRRRRCAGCAQVQESQTRRGGSASVCVVSTPSIDAIRSFAEAGLGHTQYQQGKRNGVLSARSAEYPSIWMEIMKAADTGGDPTATGGGENASGGGNGSGGNGGGGVAAGVQQRRQQLSPVDATATWAAGTFYLRAHIGQHCAFRFVC
jgi:hypothetical protein